MRRRTAVTSGQVQAYLGAPLIAESGHVVGVLAVYDPLPRQWADDEAQFEALVDRALAEDGPFLIAAKIDAAKPKATTHRDPVQIRERFMHGMGVREPL